MDQEIINNAKRIRSNIEKSQKTIYEKLTPKDKDLWLGDQELEYLLRSSLLGNSYEGQANRTRSKSINQDICRAMGYPVPKSFKKTHPRFVCQNFDKYAQQSNNLQIWNEEITPTRRYCLIILNDKNIVINVLILSGSTLQEFDSTGTLTTKYQANLINDYNESTLLSSQDTENIQNVFGEFNTLATHDPAAFPTTNSIMSIEELFNHLRLLEGKSFKITGKERTDGDILQGIVYKQLGYTQYNENGQLPDLMNQLLEIKRQTSRTIDLGLFKPDDQEELNIPAINGYVPKVEDLRYAIFYCSVDDTQMTIDKVFLVTGKDFFKYFHLFSGNKQNKKIQLHLKKEYWNL